MLALTRIYAGQAADYLSNTLGAGLLGPGCADEVELVNSTSGRWWGRGCDWVGLDGPVGDRQLENLIVDGVHPDADRIFSERLQILRGTSRACAAAAGRATQLGRRWFMYRAIIRGELRCTTPTSPTTLPVESIRVRRSTLRSEPFCGTR